MTTLEILQRKLEAYDYAVRTAGNLKPIPFSTEKNGIEFTYDPFENAAILSHDGNGIRFPGKKLITLERLIFEFAITPVSHEDYEPVQQSEQFPRRRVSPGQRRTAKGGPGYDNL